MKDLFIQGYLERISKQFNINVDDAFEIFSIAVVLDKSFDEVYNEIIILNPESNKSSSQDGGIDGVYFEENGLQCTMYVFQCKNSKKLEQGRLDKFKDNFEEIFIKGKVLPNSKDLSSKIDEYKDLTRKGYIIKHQLYFLYNGSRIDSQTSNEQLTNFYHQENVFEIIDSEILYDKVVRIIESSSRRKDIDFTFNPENSNVVKGDNQALYSYVINNVKALNFRIQATELCELMFKEESINGSLDTLYSENIRGFLGFKPKANQKMLGTLNDPNQKYYFPFLNNGLTLICEKLNIPANTQVSKYIVQVKNPLIVNGLQTSRVIYDFYKKDSEKLKDVFVNIRIYESSEKDLVDLITDATNTQTPINFKDKISNEDFNSITKELFRNNDINYLVKRGEIFNQSNIWLNKSVPNEIVLKFWYATYNGKPEIAKNSISTVLEDIYDASKITHHPLHQLFNGNKDSVIYIQLLQSYYIYDFIQIKKKLNLNNPKYSEYVHLPHADELIAYGIYNEIKSKTITKDFETEYELVNYRILEILNAEREKYNAQGKPFSIASYFKKPLCRIEYNEKINLLEDY
ncbi:MAG: AIPR family protein [Flavobacterium sp.]|uniref:AIPR family protein n=2 Tax=Flavobacterium sp. TaxID=239 RepID=UPI0022C9C090|nr:AIPR family protein [Flavobacterium sp.]MCZ8168558.1 AIPR family protein [Flavobacterium sp.]MCZ8297326.1 AIPR family protein [Flavobacterium sp.]